MALDERDRSALVAQVGAVRAECASIWDGLAAATSDLVRLRRRVSAAQAVVDQISEWLGDEGLEDESWT